MIAMPRRAAMEVSRVPKRAVGIPATARFNRFPPGAAAHGVAAGGAGIAEVEVLDDHRRASGVGRGVEQGGDRRADPPVATRGRQTGGVDGGS
jgi:hypothetical protein